jgi:hypothetical protein
MTKGDELVKYITERVVTYIETPRAERQRTRQSAKVQRGRWDVRWFGMLPLAVAMWAGGMRRALRGLRAGGRKLLRRSGAGDSGGHAAPGADSDRVRQ